MHFPLSLLHADSKTSQCLLKTGNAAVTSGCKANTAGLEPSCDQVTVIFASCPGLSIPNLRPLEGLWLDIMTWIQCLGMSFVLPARSRFLWGPLQIYSARLLMTLKRGEAVFCAARVVAGYIASTRVPCSANLTCFHWQCSTLIHRIHGPHSSSMIPWFRGLSKSPCRVSLVSSSWPPNWPSSGCLDTMEGFAMAICFKYMLHAWQSIHIYNIYIYSI